MFRFSTFGAGHRVRMAMKPVRYAEVFDTVEVNNTFYRLPTQAAVQRWVDETPDSFRFAIKGSRYTTHVKRLINFPRYSERFFEPLEPLVAGGKLGVVLWQLPGDPE